MRPNRLTAEPFGCCKTITDTDTDFQIVDEVSRDTAEHLQKTDAMLAWKPDGESGAYVIEFRED